MTSPATIPLFAASGPPEPVPVGRHGKRRWLVDRPLEPIEVECTGFTTGGRAVGKAPDGRTVFVEYALPGERVIAEITANHPTYLEACAITVLRPSPERVEPPCEYFGRCGGCQLQHAAYPEQLCLKTEVVAEQLRRIGRFEADEVAALVRPMIGMDDPWGYRNHLRFTVRRDGDVGYMLRGTHRFLRVDYCEIAHPRVNEVLRRVQGNTIVAHQLAVRIGENTGDAMIQPKIDWRPGHRAAHVESGQKTYRESLNGVQYQISGPAFFQVNTRQAERLVAIAVAHVLEANPHVVVDAYAGVGTFAGQLADKVHQIVTIEESAAAGVDAEVNLAQFENVTRITGKVEALLPGMTPEPDVVIIDPPRAGLFPAVIEAILASAARRVVYVSCDPSTLARDLRLFVDGGFVVREVQPVDMFPQTQHIECVVALDRAIARA